IGPAERRFDAAIRQQHRRRYAVKAPVTTHSGTDKGQMLADTEPVSLRSDTAEEPAARRAVPQEEWELPVESSPAPQSRCGLQAGAGCAGCCFCCCRWR